jgi:hypothetical protein
MRQEPNEAYEMFEARVATAWRNQASDISAQSTLQ